MTLRELANAIGITAEYPAEMEEIYVRLSDAPACDLQALDQLQETYHFLGAHYQAVKAAGEKINLDPLRSAWVKTAGKYLAKVTVEQACKIPVPEMNGNPENDFLALFVLLPGLYAAIAEYTRRGFSREEITELLSDFALSVSVIQRHTGYPGINQSYQNWLVLYAKNKIFVIDGFWFELAQMPVSGMWLKNKQTGKILPLVLRGPFTADGKHRIGSAGFENCADVLEITFEETMDAYIGHGVYDCVVSAKAETFPKSQWACVGKPEEPCLSLHIPTGGDISPENLRRVVELGRKFARERFPDFSSQKVYCASWLLDPTLQMMTGEHSRIAAFANCFSRYPIKNNGMSVFGFVFPRYEADYKKLPENTSLQRKIKQHYIDGKFIYFTAGIYKG